MMQAPVGVLAGNTKRDTGKKAQSGNIMAAKVQLLYLAFFNNLSRTDQAPRASCIFPGGIGYHSDNAGPSLDAEDAP